MTAGRQLTAEAIALEAARQHRRDVAELARSGIDLSGIATVVIPDPLGDRP